MKHKMLRFGGFGVALGICGTALALTFVHVEQTNLVVNRLGALDVPPVPPLPNVDPLLQNPWGIVTTRAGLVFVADNGTSVWTVYDTTGNHLRTIDIPGAGGPLTAAPDGLVQNFDEDAFEIPAATCKDGDKHDRPSRLLSSSEDGTVAGWNPAVDPTHAFVLLDNSSANTMCDISVPPSAIYKGLAIVGKSRHDGGDARLFVTNFACEGRVEAYDEDFNFLFAFTDDNPPPIPQPRENPPPADSTWAPFNVAVVDGRIFVSFAVKATLDAHDESHCTGCGFIDEVDRDGHIKNRVVANDTLNAPWAMLRAPDNFGPFADQLLVGNFGNGKINAYSLSSLQFLGRLSGPQTNCTDSNVGHQFCVDGLWGIAPGRTRETKGALFFAAGLNDEADGLMATLRPD